VEVLRLMVAGRSNPEIAAALFASPRTTQIHVGTILAKLGVENRPEAAVHAARLGLVRPDVLPLRLVRLAEARPAARNP